MPNYKLGVMYLTKLTLIKYYLYRLKKTTLCESKAQVHIYYYIKRKKNRVHYTILIWNYTTENQTVTEFGLAVRTTTSLKTYFRTST